MRTALALVALFLLALPASAQDFSKVEIRTVRVAPGLHMLAGRGGNIAVSTGADGPVLVDDQFAPLVPKIEAAVAALQSGPIRFVINTHWHGDHTGGNEALGKTGALLIAHQEVRRRMLEGQVNPALNRTIPPAAPGALPVLTFQEDVTLHWNGEELSVEHLAPAHTDGDSVVWFRGANAVHLGDLYFNGFYPFIDVWSGGSIEGVIAGVEQVLARVNPDTKIIPGHGPLSDVPALRRYAGMLATVRDRVKAAVVAGQPLEAFVASKPLADLDPTWGGGFLDSDRFLGIIYTDLTGDL